MIESEEFRSRRERLLTETGPGSMVIVSSAKEVLRNGDSTYAFRQDSDFWYLTGLDEPEALLV
ncbi:MAG TPA: aminopeptidase P N-terminal domain-containing protein, partial [Wenzhouxiangella sp.]|nr:aminopeptidase P N-terminal domain-containing protein [Wenzhouxiangella sp.]